MSQATKTRKRDQLQPRTCIVCETEFQPKRVDQIYCGTDRQYDCWNALKDVVDRSELLYLHALAQHNYCCFRCGRSGLNVATVQGVDPQRVRSVWKSTRLLGQSGDEGGDAVKLAPLCLSPSNIGRGVPMTADDFAPSCKGCRREYYIELATNSPLAGH